MLACAQWAWEKKINSLLTLDLWILLTLLYWYNKTIRNKLFSLSLVYVYGLISEKNETQTKTFYCIILLKTFYCYCEKEDFLFRGSSLLRVEKEKLYGEEHMLYFETTPWEVSITRRIEEAMSQATVKDFLSFLWGFWPWNFILVIIATVLTLSIWIYLPTNGLFPLRVASLNMDVTPKN